MNEGEVRQPVSEDAVLELIDRFFPNQHPGVALGRGDDCAILDQDRRLCVSSDLFLEDVHFRHDYFTPEDIGHKALAVNLSDIAAMGARPLAFTLNLALPRNVDLRWLELFFTGMAQLAEEEGVMLAGGDLSAAGRFHISITILGKCPQNGILLRRGGSMPGDILFLVGEIGLARVGLEEMEKYGRSSFTQWPAACAAHVRPRPRIREGLMLGRAGQNARPPALMDISDGLAADLPRLLKHAEGSGSLGAEIFLPDTSLHEEVVRHARTVSRDPAVQAYLGGEDYALLGACAADMFASLHAAIPELRQIGVVRSGGRIFLNGKEMTGVAGFDHFSI